MDGLLGKQGEGGNGLARTAQCHRQDRPRHFDGPYAEPRKPLAVLLSWKRQTIEEAIAIAKMNPVIRMALP